MMGWMFSFVLFIVWFAKGCSIWELLIASGLFAIAGAIANNCGKR